MKYLFLILGIIVLFCVTVSAQDPAAGITGKGSKLGFDMADINTETPTTMSWMISSTAAPPSSAART